MSDTTIGTSLTPIGSPILMAGRFHRTGLVVKNTGAVAFNAFAIQRQYFENGPWCNWLGSADFAIAKPGILPWVCETTPATLAGPATADLEVLSGDVFAIQCLASVASGTTTANVNTGPGVLS